MGKWRSFAKGASETGNKKQMKMKKMNKKQCIQVTKGENYSVETNQPLMPSGSQYWVKTSVPKDTFCAAGRHRWHLAKWYYICMVWERIAKNKTNINDNVFLECVIMYCKLLVIKISLTLDCVYKGHKNQQSVAIFLTFSCDAHLVMHQTIC